MAEYYERYFGNKQDPTRATVVDGIVVSIYLPRNASLLQRLVEPSYIGKTAAELEALGFYNERQTTESSLSKLHAS